MFFVFKKILKKYKNRKWKMYLFYNGICIKKIRVRNKPVEAMYIRVIGHKALFGSNNVGLVVIPTKLLKRDDKHKKVYWGVIFEMGVDIE